MLSCSSHAWLFATLRTVAHQAPLSMGSSRQEYGVGCHVLLQVSCSHLHLFVLPGGSGGKESACSVGNLGFIPGLGKSCLNSSVFWIACCSFYINLCCFMFYFFVMETTSFLNLMNPSLFASIFSSPASSPISAFTELKWLGPCSDLNFGSRQCYVMASLILYPDH